MKKLILLSFFTLVITCSSRATIVTVNVSNFQFSPALVNVLVGDTVRFFWVSGFHSATSDVIPPGALSFNSGNHPSPFSFDYRVLIPGNYTYYCLVHGGPGGVGMAASFNASLPLPLRLTSFDASLNASATARIEWTTAEEKDVAFFSLRRSTDGNEFTEISKINSAGQDNGSYHYEDANLPASRYIFYELVTQDLSGKLTYSKIITLKNTNSSGVLITRLNPNPVKAPEQVMVQFNAEKEGQMNVEVFDRHGRSVIKTTMQAYPGLNNGHLHICELTAGTYEIRFSYEGITETKTVVVR